MLQLWRILVAGTRNFLRNAWLSTAATAIMTVTLCIVIVSFISNSALTSTIKNVTDKIDISIYLSDSVTPEQRQTFQSALVANSNVASVHYTSKDQAVAEYSAKHSTDLKLLQALQVAGNALPASFQVRAKDPKKLDQIIAVTNQPQFKPLLDPTAPPSYAGQNKTTIDRIVRISNFFKTTGLIASAIFVFISTLIIFNTIRMAIFTRKEEIEIMKLVGATKWFIRGPFVFEAMLYGAIAAVIATGLSYALILGVGPNVKGYIDVQPVITFFQHYPALVITGELIIGLFIGAFSSVLAMSRYLKL
ncbi:MAG TPA: permease-like cell division protein FtsX [Candidatus Saccharimonadia bacterium]|jgi:cell division transport system permease protein|nr:permease-like cell division protein FtsX [Candidatus Saccharimonadia bacterium]